MIRAASFVLSLFVSIAGLGATEGRCILQSRTWGGDGPVSEVVVVNDFAFFGGETLRVADLTDPAEPQFVRELRLGAGLTDLDAREDRIYVVDGGPDLTVVDASVPIETGIEGVFAPVESGATLHLIDIDGDLAVVGTVSGSSSELIFLDLSGPSWEPLVVGSIQIDGDVDSLALGNDVAVASSRSDRIWFIDASDPTAPELATELEVSSLLISGEVRDMAANGNILAMADSFARLNLIDIEDPEGPAYLALVRDLNIGIPVVAFDGSTLHATGSICTNLGVCGGYALIDAANPRNPVVLGRFDGPELARPAGYGDFVMTAAFQAGLRVIDAGDPSDPILLDAMLPSREVGAIASAGPLVHVVDTTNFFAPDPPERNTLRVLERAPDGYLYELSSYRPEGAIWALDGASFFVAAAIWDQTTEFHSVEVIDVSDPSEPVLGTRLGAKLSLEWETLVPHLAMIDDRMYLSLEDSNQILIYRLSDGGVATQIGTVEPRAELLHFAVSSKKTLAIAVRQGDGGWVDIVDTSDPSSPVLAGSVEMPDPIDRPVSVEAEASRVAVLGVDLDGGFGPLNYSFVVDVSDPTEPTVSIDPQGVGEWIALSAGVLHSMGETVPPAGLRHWAADVSVPPDVGDAETLGSLDVYRNHVDTDGSYFCLSRGRLESHRYELCGRTIGATLPSFAATTE